MSKCERCGSAIDAEGFCEDATCPFSDHIQTCKIGWINHCETLQEAESEGEHRFVGEDSECEFPTSCHANSGYTL